MRSGGSAAVPGPLPDAGWLACGSRRQGPQTGQDRTMAPAREPHLTFRLPRASTR